MKKADYFNSDGNERSITLGSGVSSLTDFLLRPIFLMTKPTYYDPNPALKLKRGNGKIDNKKSAGSNYSDFNHETACVQHEKLRAIKHDLGASIVLDQGESDQIDGVFAADPSITFMRLQIDANKRKITGVHFDTLASFFYNSHRQGEVMRQISSIVFLKRYISEIFDIKVSSRIHKPKVHGEGTGDNVYDPYRDMFFSGFKKKSKDFAPDQGRSDPEFHERVLHGVMGVPTFGYEVQNGCFHSDTVISPTGEGDIVVYPDGMTSDDFAKIKAMTDKDDKSLIMVGDKDSTLYAQNLTPMPNRNVITAETTDKFKEDLSGANYTWHQTKLDQFIEFSGGGAHCLGNRIILRRDELLKAMELLEYTY